MIKQNTKQTGQLLVLILVFGAIFVTMITAFMGYVIVQKNVQDAKRNQEKALAIAEAGLNYYKWFLAHYPDDTTNNSSSSQPFVIPYEDPVDGAVGEYSLIVTANEMCGEVASIDIESTGYTYDDPGQTKVLNARYAQPTVAEYAYIINADVWAGDDRTIIGPYHSNGIIRMDGTNNSTVSSGQENWVCDNAQLNCDPPYNEGDTLDAVFGSGPNSALWQTSVPPIDFVGITLDLSAMETKADTGGGRLFGDSGGHGYHVYMQNTNIASVYRVDSVTDDHDILSETKIGDYSVPVVCPLLFFQDKVWLEGEIATKMSIVAAKVGDSEDPTMILQNDITYFGDDGGLLAVAEDDVLIGIDVPEVMEVNGIFVAQNGRFGRDFYDSGDVSAADVFKDELTIHGTIVSNERVGTKWTCGGTYCSGFETRFNSYDRDLVEDPPPLAPETSADYRFIEWRQE